MSYDTVKPPSNGWLYDTNATQKANNAAFTLPREVETAKHVDRNSLLEELQHDLDELLGTRTNLLRSAGAVAIRANREQLRRIARHPLVRVVRSNRRLRPGNVAG